MWGRFSVRTTVVQSSGISLGVLRWPAWANTKFCKASESSIYSKTDLRTLYAWDDRSATQSTVCRSTDFPESQNIEEGRSAETPSCAKNSTCDSNASATVLLAREAAGPRIAHAQQISLFEMIILGVKVSEAGSQFLFD